MVIVQDYVQLAATEDARVLVLVDVEQVAPEVVKGVALDHAEIGVLTLVLIIVVEHAKVAATRAVKEGVALAAMCIVLVVVRRAVLVAVVVVAWDHASELVV